MQLDHLRARLGAEKLKNGVQSSASISKLARQLFAAPDLAPPRARRIRTPALFWGAPKGIDPQSQPPWGSLWA